MLYITSLGLIHSLKWKFVPLNPLDLFCHPPTSLPSGNHQFALCICKSVSVLFVHLFFRFNKEVRFKLSLLAKMQLMKWLLNPWVKPLNQLSWQ